MGFSSYRLNILIVCSYMLLSSVYLFPSEARCWTAVELWVHSEANKQNWSLSTERYCELYCDNRRYRNIWKTFLWLVFVYFPAPADTAVHSDSHFHHLLTLQTKRFISNRVMCCSPLLYVISKLCDWVRSSDKHLTGLFLDREKGWLKGES